VLRPTTTEAVLYASVSDADRIVASGRLGAVAKGRLRLATAPASADGVAIIDAPDVDSVERDNRELADVLVEASDLCVFVTTATRVRPTWCRGRFCAVSASAVFRSSSC